MQISSAQKADNKLYYHNSGGPGKNLIINNGAENFTGQSGTGANIDVVYHRIWWRINPDSAKAIRGTVTTYFKTIQANVSSITFDLRQSAFNNASLIVTYHGISCTKSVSAANILSITLPSTIVSSGTLDSVVVNYYGVPPGVVGAAQGYQVATDATSAQNVIYTLSESYEDRDWWPCKADMQDKIDSMDIIVNVPWGSPAAKDTFWVATNGKLVDSTISGGSRTFTFKNRYAMASYLVCVSVARYNRYYRTINIGGTNVPVAYYLIRGKSAANYTTITNAMDLINQVVVAFSNKFGDYPYKYEKHGFYDGLAGAGGMEHQTFSAIDGGTTNGGIGSLASTSVLSHELMHQWFGDKATCATWADLWLAEGFARYAEALAGELVPATGLNPVTERSAAKTSARSLSTNRTRITSFTTSAQVWSNANVAAVYDRGCMVVSMLRALSGDNNFFLACRNYLDSTNGSGYKSATSDSLKLNFNRVINYDLTPFFNDWVIGQGHPTTVVNWNSPTTKKLAVSIGSQTRTASASAAYFHNVVVLRVQGAIPATQDTTIVIYDIDGNNLAKAGLSTGIGPTVPGNLLMYDLSFTPTTVTFDAFNQTMSAGSTFKLTTLAAKVLDFYAFKTTTGNQINLSLANNEPVEKVILLKSANGTDFTDAGLMVKTNTSGSINNYQFNDVLPFSPVTFYKAKIYTSGREEFTGIVRVQQAAGKYLIISPNPVKDVVNISFNNSDKVSATVRVVNADGKIVIESSTKNDFIHFDVSNLSAGIYMLQVIKPGEITDTKRFLVNR
ncbi:MAG: M1 family aminopeptidase [Ferruginibacter sp.]